MPLRRVDHCLDHLVKALVVLRVDYLEALDVETTLGGSCLDFVNVADEDGSEEAAGFQAGGTLEDTGVRALGIDYLAGILFEYFNKVLKHFATASILIWRTLRRFQTLNFTTLSGSFQAPAGALQGDKGQL